MPIPPRSRSASRRTFRAIFAATWDAVGRLRADADRLQAESSGALRHLTHELMGSGFSVRDAAVILGISHQRVSQLVRGESERVAGAR
jgi:predicted XRE-type DNA-binding protein